MTKQIITCDTSNCTYNKYSECTRYEIEIFGGECGNFEENEEEED